MAYYEFIVMTSNFQNVQKNRKNHNSDFCDEFMNIYECTNLISWDNLWFSIESTQQEVIERQVNTINANTCKPYSSVKSLIALGELKYCCCLRKTNELNKS